MTPRRSLPADDAAASDLSLPDLAHQLNGLLDGSMRSLRLAHRALGALPEDARHAEAMERLRRAESSMHDIADLLERVMVGRTGAAGILGTERGLADEVVHTVEGLAACAADGVVAVDYHIDPAIAHLPAGPLGALLHNALRNAIEACIRAKVADARVAVAVTLEGSTIEVAVRDNGPGFDAGAPPDGHGLGLGVCRRIVGELGGTIDVGPAGDAPGAHLRARVPLERLRSS